MESEARITAVALALILLVAFSIMLGVLAGSQDSYEVVVFNIRLELPIEAYRLGFKVVVANLTAEGIKVIEKVFVKPTEEDLVCVNVRMLKKLIGYRYVWENGKPVEKILIYRAYGTFIYAVAYDPKTRTFYYGSWTRSINPYYNRTVNAVVKVKAYHSTEVTAKDVPDIGQSSSFHKERYTICAAKIPGYTAWREVYIPAGMQIPIDSWEKEYWTESSYPREPDTVWYEEPWEKSGTTTVTTDTEFGPSRADGPLSIRHYLYKVKYIMATTGEINPGAFSYVIVKVYAVDTDDNTIGSETPWYPPNITPTEVGSIARPDPGPLKFSIGIAVHPTQVSYSTTFRAVAPDYETTVEISETFTYEIKEGYISIGVGSWDEVPSEYNYLRIYQYKKGLLEAKFTET